MNVSGKWGENTHQVTYEVICYHNFQLFLFNLTQLFSTFISSNWSRHLFFTLSLRSPVSSGLNVSILLLPWYIVCPDIPARLAFVHSSLASNCSPQIRDPQSDSSVHAVQPENLGLIEGRQATCMLCDIGKHVHQVMARHSFKSACWVWKTSWEFWNSILNFFKLLISCMHFWSQHVWQTLRPRPIPSPLFEFLIGQRDSDAVCQYAPQNVDPGGHRQELKLKYLKCPLITYAIYAAHKSKINRF